MNLRTLLTFGLLFAGPALLPAADQPAPPAPPAATPPAASPAAEALNALVARIKAKLASGAADAAALEGELKEFDVLVASNRTADPEVAAQAMLMKAALYLQVLEDIEQASVVLNQLKADFGTTGPGKTVDALLGRLEAQRESLKLQAALKPGAVFPDFDEKDLNGAPLSIAKFKGKPVLIDFWATWCGPCVAELPNVQAAYAKYHDKGFEIIGISLDRSEDALKKFIAEKNMTWPQYFDGKAWDSALGRRYGVSSIPATYLLDGDGKIVAKNLRGPALEQELAKLLGE